MKATPSILLATLAVACGSPEPAPSPAPIAPAPPILEPPRPAPGLDLDGSIAPADPGPPVARKPAVPLDLLADRAVVPVRVPVPPRGGAVGFTFADDRPGWVARIPDSRQLPSVGYGHGKIYVSGGFESVSFYALDAITGRLAWATTNLEDNGPTAPVIDGDEVLFNTESCTLFALDAKTGKRKWYRWLGDPTLAQIAVADGVVYSAHPSKDHHDIAMRFALSAFKTKTGTPVWSRPIDDELLVTPVIAGDSVYASTVSGTTYRFHRHTGKLVWRRALHATTAPWIAGEELFVSRRHNGREQQVVVDVATGKVVRQHQVGNGTYWDDVPHSGDDWKKTWAFEGSRPVVDRGIRYVAMGRDIHATDANSGEALWHRRYPSKTSARALGSVAIAGSTVVTATRDGKIFGLDVDTGYTLWSYDIGHRVAAAPVIAQGWLYAATEDGYVVALEVADRSLDGWHMFGGNPQKNGAMVSRGDPPVEGVPGTQPTTAIGPTIEPGALALRSSPASPVQPHDVFDLPAFDDEPVLDAAARAKREQKVEISVECLVNPLCDKSALPVPDR